MDGLFVGKDVALSGTISQYNQRNATYTHMIQTTQYESVGIRSTRVVL